MTPIDATCACGCGGLTPLAKCTNRRKGHVKGQPVRYIRGHNGRVQCRYKVEDRGYESPCWIWQLSLFPNGYGQYPCREGDRGAHRVYYQRYVGPIPEGLQLDHLCNVPACVNPWHLRPVTAAENVRRRSTMKLSLRDVERIRELSAAGVAGRKIAEQFGVSQSHVSRVVRREQWES